MAATIGAFVLAPAASGDTPGDYIVSDDPGTGAVYRFTPAGVRSTITTGGNLVNPEGLARLGADDYVVAEKGAGAPADGSVVRVKNGTQSVLASGGNLFDPHGIAVSYDRKTVYTVGRDGRVVAITVANGTQRLIVNLGAGFNLRGVAVERSGALLAAKGLSATQLLRIDPNTGAQSTVFSGAPFTDMRSVLVRPNGDLVVGDQGLNPVPMGPDVDGFLAGIDLPAATANTFAAGSFFAGNSVPGALGLDTKGDVIVADRNNTAPAGGPGRIYRVTFGGAITEIVTPASGLLSEASGLAIVPPKCGGKFATIVGTPGKDSLPGTNGNDVITALGGKDTAKGKGGKDVICGGAGNDNINGGGGNDNLIPGKGKDKVKGGAGKDKLKCSSADLRCG